MQTVPPAVFFGRATARDDVAVIPLVSTMSSWASRKGVATYHPVPIGWAWAMLADPAA